MNAFIIGAATTKFGELWESSSKTLARDAFENALKDSSLDKKNIEALFIGDALSGILGGQINLGPLFAQYLGLANVPAFHIEGAGASGGLAINAAINSVLSEQYKTVAILGIEKMTDYKPEVIAAALMGAGSREEKNSGVTLAGLYAMIAREYMSKYNVNQTELAAVPVKNHLHANLNPNAQFHNLLTIDSVLKSPLVADPLKLLECAPTTDGAAALIITSTKPSEVIIAASETATDSLDLASRLNLTEFAATRIACQKAYAKSGLKPKDIDIAEVHDCFGIAEIIALEDLGFFEAGLAARAISTGQVTLGLSKRLTVNTSGGLKGAGDPIGATGIKQIVEIVDQLKGRAGTRQVRNAKIGLAQNVGGSGGTAVIHILKKL